MEINAKRSEIQSKHVLAIDYGQKFTGLSNYKVGIDPFILLYGRIEYESDDQLVKSLQEIVDEEFVEILVLGVPRFTDGKDSTMTKTILAFGEKLKKGLPDIDVYYIDETLTTFEAEERMKNDPRFNFAVDLKQIDAMSASIILEEFVNNSSE